jgi:flavodoxin
MKILVAYFSKTGNTKKLAQKLAKNLNSEIDEIIDVEKIGEEGMMKDVKISFKKNPSEYGIVLVGSPVWAFGIPPFVKKYLQENKFNKIAFFCTFGLSELFLFYKMKKLSKKPIAKLGIKYNKIEDSNKKTKLFCEKIKLEK